MRISMTVGLTISFEYFGHVRKSDIIKKDGQSDTVGYVDILMNLCIGNCLNILENGSQSCDYDRSI